MNRNKLENQSGSMIEVSALSEDKKALVA